MEIRHLFALGIGLLITFYINDRKRVIEYTQDDKLEMKLESLIPKPLYFRFRPEFIHFYYNIREFRSYNEPLFDTLIENTDIILRIHQDMEIGVKECGQNIDVVKDKIKETMNSLHSFVYKTPVNEVSRTKLHKSMRVLQILFKKELDEMIDLCNQQLRQNRMPQREDFDWVKPKISGHWYVDDEYFDVYV